MMLLNQINCFGGLPHPQITGFYIFPGKYIKKAAQIPNLVNFIFNFEVCNLGPKTALSNLYEEKAFWKFLALNCTFGVKTRSKKFSNRKVKNFFFDTQVSIYQLKGPSFNSTNRAILSFQGERCPRY
jgi:hypothetical protein